MSYNRLNLRRMVSVLFLIMLMGATGVALYAQGLGSIVGTVADTTGGILPAAKVKITDEGTSQTREVLTNSQGYYVFPSLRPASYTLAVEAQGFAVYTWKAILLQADQSALRRERRRRGQRGHQIRHQHTARRPL